MSSANSATRNTEEVLAERLENAARILCAIRELDPDSKVRVPHPQGLVPFVEQELWKSFVPELVYVSTLLTALRLGAEHDASASAGKQETVQ